MTTTRTIAIDQGYTDGIIPHWRFAREVLCPRFHWGTFYNWFCCVKGEMDAPNIYGGWNYDRTLARLDAFPRGATVLMDYEGIAGTPYDFNTWTIHPAVVERTKLLAKLARAKRPDITLGYFYYPVGAYDFWMDYPDDFRQRMEICNRQLIPMLRDFHFVTPCLYSISHHGEPEKIVRQIRRIMSFCRKAIPWMLRPIIWAQWEDFVSAHPDASIWTPEQIKQGTLPGPLFRTILNTLSNEGITDVLLWGYQNLRWSDDWDWVREVNDWMKN